MGIANVSQLVKTVLDEENNQDNNHDVEILLSAVDTLTLEGVIKFYTILMHCPNEYNFRFLSHLLLANVHSMEQDNFLCILQTFLDGHQK